MFAEWERAAQPHVVPTSQTWRIRQPTMNPVPHPALQPFDFGPFHLYNRLAVAPMSRVSTAGDGVPTEQMARYYAAFAEGGFGLVVTEGAYPDSDRSQAYWNQPGIATEAQMLGWGHVAEEVHRAGARVILQLMHAGALVQEQPRHAHGLAPSAVPPRGRKMSDYGGRGPYAMPSAATEVELVAARDGFVAAARRAVEAGFDGVEVHGANGYLLDQFVTAYTNHRTDRYGGSPAHRVQFPAEVAAAVRAAVPDEFIVGYRLSQAKVNDATYRWPGGAEEAKTYYTALAEAGVDYLHLAGEGADWASAAELEPGITTTGLAREVTGLPVIANGGLGSPEALRRVIAEGHADLVALGTSALANPDFPKRLAARLPLDPFDPAIFRPAATLDNAAHVRAGDLVRGV